MKSIMSVLLFLFCGAAMAEQSIARAAPVISAESAILLDYTTGTVLFEKNADLLIPPASLTKLITIAIAEDVIENGSVNLNEEVEIKPEYWAVNMPRDSSLMFLGPHQRVSLRDLLKGIAVSSGNDAAYALADFIAGSVSGFVELMNQKVRNLGFTTMHFVEPSGMSSKNRITAREYAAFCRDYINRHPESLKELYSLKEFTFPRPENLKDGYKGTPITQYNRNSLLWSLEGVDGLKTGFIEASGYNIALTAQRDGMRVIAVLLGIPGNDHYQGSANR
ncbi:MAG: D-alanyl-D-alanine carboxypeptidase family protein, partial [Spirochaetota bacterium]